MITTKTGDRGETSLYDGTRVSKDDARIELNGELDELNALLGLCKATAGQTEPYETVQRELMTVMAIVAEGYRHPAKADELAQRQNELMAAVERMEAEIRERTVGRRFSFVLPGRDPLDAALHMARTKTRTCERRLVSIIRMEQTSSPKVPASTKQSSHAAHHSSHEISLQPYTTLQTYLNRLSDFLFCLTVR